MRRLVTILLASFIVGLIAFSNSEPAECAACKGGFPCKACRSCTSCAHCAKRGGVCGVCYSP